MSEALHLGTDHLNIFC